MALAKMTLAIVPVMLLLLHTTTAGAFSVVAYGDSFTEGWDPATKLKTPYTDTLGACFGEEGVVDFIIENKGTGWSGVLMPATAKIPKGNLTANLLGFLAEDPVVYDWSILWLAGVNDISNSNPPTPFPYASAIEKYTFLWELLLKQGSNVLVMPQPTLLFAAKTDVLEVIRVKLAAMLEAAVAATTPPKGTTLAYLDIATILAGINTNATMKFEYLSQGIHLKSAGYARVGEEVCKVLAPRALDADAEAPPSPLKSPPAVIKAPAKSPAASPPAEDVAASPAPAAATPTEATPPSSPADVVAAPGSIGPSFRSSGTGSSSTSGSSTTGKYATTTPPASTGAAAMAAAPTLSALAALLLCLLQWA